MRLKQINSPRVDQRSSAMCCSTVAKSFYLKICSAVLVRNTFGLQNVSFTDRFSPIIKG